MKIEVQSRPSYAMAVLGLDPGETVSVESGSMVAMRGVETKTRLATNFLQAVVRKLFGGESMFLNDFTAGASGGQVWIAPALVGDIYHHRLEGSEILVEGGSFLACGQGVNVQAQWAGWRMLFGGEGAIFMKCSGTGELLFNAYGGIEVIPIDGSYTIDTGHVVAYETSLQPKLHRVGNWKSTFFSGEGLVLTLTGQGRLWIQTRSVGSLVKWLRPLLPA